MKSAISRILPLFIVLFIFSGWISTPVLAQEKKEKKEKGKIGDFEDQVKKTNREDSEEEDENEEVSFGLFFFINSPDDILFLPRLLIGTFLGEDSLVYYGNFWQVSFSDYPYCTKDDGLFAHRFGKDFSLQFSSHYFYNSDVLQGIGLRAHLSPRPILGVEIHYTDLTEKLKTRYDHLRLYDIFLNYYRVRKPRWVVWWGIGLKGMQGDNSYQGFGFNLGTDVYPVQPVSLHLDYSKGWINGQSLSEFLIRMNLHLQRTIFFIGYQRFSAGSSVLDGAVFGVGVFL